MNQDLPQNKNTNEEVDLIVFFNLIGSAFNKVFAFIASIFTGILSGILFLFRVVFLNIKLIVVVIILSVILGMVLDKYKSKVYYAEMFVVPHFDSKYELISNINYFNSLIKLKDIDELSNQFKLSEEESKSLLEFEIEIGPESYNDQIEAFNGFLKNLDSVTKTKVTFEDYLDDRGLYSSNIYRLKARSKNYEIFKKLEVVLGNSINNDYSDLKLKERDDVLVLEEKNLRLALAEVKQLKAAYMDVLEKESNKTNVSSSLSNSLGLQVEKSQTKEDVLLEKELKILEQINAIQKQTITDNTIFDTIGAFKEKGIIENIWYKKYTLILPVLGLLLLFSIAIFLQFYKYTINYSKENK